MVVAQRAQCRRDHVRRVAPGERLDRGPPHAPTGVAEEAEQRIGIAGGSASARTAAARSRTSGSRLRKLGSQLALALEAGGDVLDRHHHADDLAVLAQRSDGDALLHAVEVGGSTERRAADQVAMKRRRQDLNRAALEHLLEGSEQTALRESGTTSSSGRPTARSGGMPVARASHPSQVRTSERGRW